MGVRGKVYSGEKMESVQRGVGLLWEVLELAHAEYRDAFREELSEMLEADDLVLVSCGGALRPPQNDDELPEGDDTNWILELHYMISENDMGVSSVVQKVALFISGSESLDDALRNLQDRYGGAAAGGGTGRLGLGREKEML